MKKNIHGFDIEFSDWTPKLKIITITCVTLTVISLSITWLLNYSVPGLTSISFGITMLLLGIREFNIYYKEKKSIIILFFGILLTLLFAYNLYNGIDQILTEIFKFIF